MITLIRNNPVTVPPKFLSALFWMHTYSPWHPPSSIAFFLDKPHRCLPSGLWSCLSPSKHPPFSVCGKGYPFLRLVSAHPTPSWLPTFGFFHLLISSHFQVWHSLVTLNKFKLIVCWCNFPYLNNVAVELDGLYVRSFRKKKKDSIPRAVLQQLEVLTLWSCWILSQSCDIKGEIKRFTITRFHNFDLVIKL